MKHPHHVRAGLLIAAALVLSSCGKKGGGPTTPTPGNGGISVETTPPNAQLFVDGSAKGTVYAGGLSVSGLSAGSHAVMLTMRGYRDTTLSVVVASGATTNITVGMGSKPGTPRVFELFLALGALPTDVAIGPADNVYALTHAPEQLLVNDSSGAAVASVALSGDANRLAVASTGDAYFVRNHVIEHRSSAGSVVGSIFEAGSAPWGGIPPLVSGPSDSLFVLAGSSLGPSGDHVRIFLNDGSAGSWTIGRTLSLLAADRAAHRLYLVSADSVLAYTTGGHPRGGWPCTGAVEIAVGADGSLYVARTVLGEEGTQVKRFSTLGAVLAEWTTPVRLAYGLAVDGMGRVYLGDYDNHTLVRYVP